MSATSFAQLICLTFIASVVIICVDSVPVPEEQLQIPDPSTAAPLEDQDDPVRLKRYSELGLQPTPVEKSQPFVYLHPDSKGYPPAYMFEKPNGGTPGQSSPGANGSNLSTRTNRASGTFGTGSSEPGSQTTVSTGAVGGQNEAGTTGSSDFTGGDSVITAASNGDPTVNGSLNQPLTSPLSSATNSYANAVPGSQKAVIGAGSSSSSEPTGMASNAMSQFGFSATPNRGSSSVAGTMVTNGGAQGLMQMSENTGAQPGEIRGGVSEPLGKVTNGGATFGGGASGGSGSAVGGDVVRPVAAATFP